MTLDPSLRARREAIVLEHMTAENAHEFDRCIDAFSHARYEIIATGEVWDGKDGVNELLLQNITAFPDFKFVPESMHYAGNAVFVEGRFTRIKRNDSSFSRAATDGALARRQACRDPERP